ncbi:MAG: protein translocase subunit SecD [Gammaproteobacteria bacterium]|nr:protein translocase subunit SecD [Gammaproteobacteria bacterium]
MNRYPLWKNLLILAVMIFGFLYAIPNLYGEVPVVQISALRGASLGEAEKTRIEQVLKGANLGFLALEQESDRITLRFADTELQLKAQDQLIEALGEDYVVALNLVPATPKWMEDLNAAPMYLGLDLRGGVHFLMQVDMDAAVAQAEERYVSDLRSLLRDDKIRYLSISRASGGVEAKFRSTEDRAAAQERISREFPALLLNDSEADGAYYLVASLSDKEVLDAKNLALQQNVLTLRNRINELGVAEPVIQRQGSDRIVVQLPGVQDPARAKEILGATATLEFRMVDANGDLTAALAGKTPIGSRLYRERNGNPVLLERRIIVTGDQIIDAASGLDQQSGSPAVYVTLDSKGARQMLQTTKENIGKPMAVVFIENKSHTRMVDGAPVKETKTVEEVINVATIRDQFSKRFQITGLDSPTEARNLALLLRAGALAAPIEIIEERTVGPSLGAQNIERGFNSTLIGFAAIVLFMSFYYRVFGVIASVSLFSNLVLLVAILSMLQATLTLPGIAGIALTIGMAIDANVLIFERVREELRLGNSPQAAIHAGYERAWGTILDSNVTTLIAGFSLFLLGSGPVRGFAVVLCIGILTSMFSAVMISRSLVNLVYGGRKLSRLAI